MYVCVQWLTEEFVPYLKQWEESVQKRVGFTPQAKGMMLLAKETRHGIDVTGILILLPCTIIILLHILLQLNHL